jgi:antitoxin MazE
MKNRGEGPPSAKAAVREEGPQPYTERQMKAQLSKWGHSLALRIPKPVAEAAKLCEGDTLDLDVVGPGTVRMRKPTPKLTLAELVARITEENRHGETDWREAVGNERW